MQVNQEMGFLKRVNNKTGDAGIIVSSEIKAMIDHVSGIEIDFSRGMVVETPICDIKS
jgi:hypothetical protein